MPTLSLTPFILVGAVQLALSVWCLWRVRHLVHVVTVLSKVAGDQNHYLKEAFRLVETMKANAIRQEDWVNYVVHELRAPIANIQTSNQMMSLVDSSHPNYQRYGKIIQQECHSSLEIINDLLALYRSQLQSERREIDLVEYSRQVVEAFEMRLQRQGGVLNLKINNHLAKVAQIDAAKVETVLCELLNNACKYSKDSIVDVSITLRRNDLLMVVKNAADIPPDVMMHLCDKFYRYQKADLRHEGGSGLGLFIVKALVEIMGGVLVFRGEHHCFEVEVAIPLMELAIYEVNKSTIPCST